MKQTCSIALITYNGEKYLARQLETLATQTRLPDELVVCDDCSTDKTMEILEAFTKTAPFPVRIYRNEENIGWCLNFHKAYFLCEKEIIFFCDQDDIWLPHKIKTGMEVFEKEPEVGMVLMTDLRVDCHEKSLPFSYRFSQLESPLKEENSFLTLLKASKLGWAAHNMACRACWREMVYPGNPRPELAFDVWVFNLMGVLAEVRVIMKPTLLFRRHGENITSNSGKVRNPLKRLRKAIWKHYDMGRLRNKYHFASQLIKALEAVEKPLIPGILEFHRRQMEHHKSRMIVWTSWFSRFWLVPREYFNGNYKRFAHGLRDALADFVALPQKLPKLPE